MRAIILNIAEVGLRVNDLPGMVAFYQEMLGLEPVLSGPNYVFLKVADLPSALGSVGHPQLLVLFDRQTEPDIALSTLDHLAFEIPADEYADELEHFKSLGMVLRERSWPDSLDWRARSFFFRDPEGNIVELVAAEGGES